MRRRADAVPSPRMFPSKYTSPWTWSVPGFPGVHLTWPMTVPSAAFTWQSYAASGIRLTVPIPELREVSLSSRLLAPANPPPA